jgi:hypothetical protein
MSHSCVRIASRAVAVLGIAIASTLVLAVASFEAHAKPARERGVTSQGWNFSLEHRSLPRVIAKGRLNYYRHGGAGCYKAFVTGQLRTQMNHPLGKDAYLWLVGRDCKTGKWIRMRDSVAPSAGATRPVSGNTLAHVKQVSVALCNASDMLCTVPEPRCPTCGGKQKGNPRAAAAREARRNRPRCIGPKACPVPGGPEWPGAPPLRR